MVTLHGIIQMEVLSLSLSHLKKTICKLEEEKHENATKIMKRRKKTNMWCFVGTFCFFCYIVGIVVVSAMMQIRIDKPMYLP